MASKARSSTPANKMYLSPQVLYKSVIRLTSSDDSLIATNDGTSANSANISG